MSTSPYLQEVSEIMRRARLSTGWSQSEFAEALGRSQALVSKYEAGKAVPPADVLIHCIHIAGVAVMFEQPTWNGDPNWAPVYESLRNLAVAIRSVQQSISARP